MLYHAQNASAITVGAWWEVLVPALAVAGIGVGLSLLNFGVDEISNPRLRTLGTVAAAIKAQKKIDQQRLAEVKP
jgi:peptide/nickel transport system permease protein